MRALGIVAVLIVLAACQAPAPATGPLFRHGGATSYDSGYSAWCVAHRGEGSCPP